MSIILKALKRAEGAKAAERRSPGKKVFSAKSKNTLAMTLASLATFALALFFAVYLLQSGRPKKPEGVMPKTDAPQARAVIPKTESPVPQPEAALSGKRTPSQIYEEAIENIKKNNNAAAERLLREALRAEPDNPFFLNHLGLSLKRQSKLKGAVSAYEKALKLKPDYPEAMNNLAVAIETSGRKKRAEGLYIKALSINPSYEEAHLNYAVLLESEGRVKEAEARYKTFLDLSSNEEIKTLVRKRLR
ncbi:MAG: tetratricopeptide repeat protein [Thermodesulfovibrionales bacterium]|nr:tetratricopeptide repeat protein [Thermodesulfovibrionales bacterium]